VFDQDNYNYGKIAFSAVVGAVSAGVGSKVNALAKGRRLSSAAKTAMMMRGQAAVAGVSSFGYTKLDNSNASFGEYLVNAGISAASAGVISYFGSRLLNVSFMKKIVKFQDHALTIRDVGTKVRRAILAFLAYKGVERGYDILTNVITGQIEDMVECNAD
jgi:hypothetical protein